MVNICILILINISKLLKNVFSKLILCVNFLLFPFLLIFSYFLTRREKNTLIYIFMFLKCLNYLHHRLIIRQFQIEDMLLNLSLSTTYNIGTFFVY